MIRLARFFICLFSDLDNFIRQIYHDYLKGENPEINFSLLMVIFWQLTAITDRWILILVLPFARVLLASAGRTAAWTACCFQCEPLVFSKDVPFLGSFAVLQPGLSSSLAFVVHSSVIFLANPKKESTQKADSFFCN